MQTRLMDPHEAKESVGGSCYRLSAKQQRRERIKMKANLESRCLGDSEGVAEYLYLLSSPMSGGGWQIQ